MNLTEREKQREYQKLNVEIDQRLKRHFEKAFKAVADTADGRYVLRAILEIAGPWRSTFSEDVHKMCFLEGQRNAGLMVIEWFDDISPKDYIKMNKEYSDEKNQIRLELEQSENGNRSE